jgi:hypothetical protein
MLGNCPSLKHVRCEAQLEIDGCNQASTNAAPLRRLLFQTPRTPLSINGGKSYVDISPSSLPYNFNVPGTGDINLVARVYDASGQSSAQSTRLTIAAACAQTTMQTPTIIWPTPAAISYGTALGANQLNATASVPGVFRYSSPTGTILSAGPQTITATFTPTDTANYSAAMASVTVNVTPASLTITPAAASRAYGFANPVFTYLATGFVNGETPAALSGAPAITTAAGLASAPGSYALTPLLAH